MDQIVSRPATRQDVRQRRRMRVHLNHVLFVAIFLVPLSLVAVYEFFIATDRYESVASAMITEERGGTTVDLTVLGLTNSNIAADKESLVLKEFAGSKDMLKFLDERLKLREHVSQPHLDWLSRLKDNASFEDFYEYYTDMIEINFASESKLITFAVQTFDANYSQELLKLLVARSQEFIDRVNDQVTREQMRFFDQQIAHSELRLKEAKEKLMSFQRENRLFSTEGESQTIMSTIVTLEQQLAQKQADLSARLQVLERTAPQLITLQLDIEAIRAQIAQAKERLAGSSDTSVSELDSRYRDIQLNLEFVTNVYKSNLNALEQARLEAARRLKFLVVVTQPTLAEKAEYPKRLYIVGTAAIILIIVFFVTTLMVAIVREHT